MERLLHLSTAQADPADPETVKVRMPLPVPYTDDATGWLVRIYPTGKGIGAHYPVGSEPLLIGRDSHCQVCIEGDTSVSRFHAYLLAREGAFYVTDYCSTNGTYVNDEPALVRRIKDGDSLHIGQHIFRFLVGSNVEAQYHEEISRLAMTDALTGIANRRCLVEFLERELARSVRNARPLSLVLLDIDHFKEVNDPFGHVTGDQVLRDVVTRMRTAVRTEELLARYGGEEFALVLPECTIPDAIRAAERLRHLAEAAPFQYRGKHISLTISLGATNTDGHAEVSTHEFFRRADDNVYRAKHSGRNCVVG
jgi:two-component system cell cycle response regulator